MRRTIAFGVLVAGFGLAAFALRTPIRDWVERQQRPDVPAAMSRTALDTTGASDNANAANTNVSAANVNTSVPAERNLKVPFTSQAPHANWDEDHEEFCEEASVLMVGRYFEDRTIANKDDAEAALQRLKARELELFGYFKDTTAEETARLLEDVYAVETELLRDPTVAQLKAALAESRLVIVPAAGRQLGNPNFRQPGPLYHMLVLKGYTKDGQFITNDPGTRKGADYVYPFERVMTALHDWNGGDVSNGAKVAIVVRAR